MVIDEWIHVLCVPDNRPVTPHGPTIHRGSSWAT
jgi:hypothetical protein